MTKQMFLSKNKTLYRFQSGFQKKTTLQTLVLDILLIKLLRDSKKVFSLG